MIFWTFKWIIISIIIISLIHYIYNFLLDTFTVPKVRDLLEHQNSQYQELISSLKNKNQESEEQFVEQISPTNKNISDNNETNDAMHDELQTFLNGLTTTQISPSTTNDVTKLEDL